MMERKIVSFVIDEVKGFDQDGRTVVIRFEDNFPYSRYQCLAVDGVRHLVSDLSIDYSMVTFFAQPVSEAVAQ